MGGTAVFGVISICLFFALFVGILIWAACLKKSYLNTMSELPLEADSATNPNHPAPESLHEPKR